MRILGVFFILVSGLTILFNLLAVAENERIMRDSPFITIFSLGTNLNKGCYTFAPPYTLFEIFIFALLICGIFLVVKKKKH